jgi:hypothetical protein
MTENEMSPTADTRATSADSPRQRAIKAYEDARERTADTLGQAPLIALAGGLAAGALIAALLPRTDREARLVRPTARRVRESADAAYKAARETSKQRFEELGFTKDQGQEQLRNFLRGLKDTAKASADAALDAARTKS